MTLETLEEASSIAGTFLFFNKHDAEGVGTMLGLNGSFPIQTDDGSVFWMPGSCYDELMKRIYSSWIIPSQATIPQTHKQNLLPFSEYIDTTKEEPK